MDKLVINKIALIFQDFLREEKDSRESPKDFKYRDAKASPKDLEEFGEQLFEDKLVELEDKLMRSVFGFSYHINTGKTLKREITSENLVANLCDYEKNISGFINEQCDPIGLLKQIIETDAPFLVCENEEYILGVKRDLSGLSLPQRHKIVFQVAAQVLWYLEKNKIPTIEAMRKKLSDPKSALFELLEIKKHHFNKRTIEDWVCDIFPIPKDLRKGRPAKAGVAEEYFNTLNPIPEVILDNGKMINFLKLRFVIICFSRVLRVLKWTTDQIKDSLFIKIYKRHLKFFLWLYIKNWIDASEAKNGSIFDA